MRDNKKLIDYFFVIALFSFGLYYYCFRILGFDLSRTPGDYGDSRFINYILEHGFQWLRGQDPDFWTADFMYPLKDNVAISDSMAGALPFYALFRFMGNDTETSYQLWWLSTCILNFWCCFIAFKKIGFNACLSALGAYAFAFGINNFNQFAHLQFSCKFLIPLAIAALYLYLKAPRIRYFIILILSLVLQFYSSAYLGIILFYFLAGFAVVFLLSSCNRQQFVSGVNKKLMLQCAAVVIAGVLLLLIVALPYYTVAEAMGYRDYKVEVLPNLPRVYSYFYANISTISWHALTKSPVTKGPASYLQDMFPGAFCYLGLLLCLPYLLIKAIQKKRINYLPVALVLTILLFIALSSKTESDFSLFNYFKKLPGLASMRLTTRFMIVNVFFLTWLSLFFLQKLAVKKGAVLVYGLFALLVIGDNLFKPESYLLSISPKVMREARVGAACQNIITHNTGHKKIVVCINTKQEPEAFMQLDMMLACQKLSLATLNGYSSTCDGKLCGSYDDPAHLRLSAWLNSHHIAESDVLFIHN